MDARQLGALALLLTLCIGRAPFRTILSPLGRLIGFAKRIGDGDLRAKMEIPCAGELGARQGSLETMLSDLKSKFALAEGVLKAIFETFPLPRAGQDRSSHPLQPDDFGPPGDGREACGLFWPEPGPVFL